LQMISNSSCGFQANLRVETHKYNQSSNYSSD
jgi:hypothetical protein